MLLLLGSVAGKTVSYRIDRQKLKLSPKREQRKQGKSGKAEFIGTYIASSTQVWNPARRGARGGMYRIFDV